MKTKLSLGAATGLLLLVLLVLLGSFKARAAQFSKFDGFGAQTFTAQSDNFANGFGDFNIAFNKFDAAGQGFSSFGEAGFSFSSFQVS